MNLINLYMKNELCDMYKTFGISYDNSLFSQQELMNLYRTLVSMKEYWNINTMHSISFSSRTHNY